MARQMADCRRWASESNCSLVIIGEEDEVVRAAAVPRPARNQRFGARALRRQRSLTASHSLGATSSRNIWANIAMKGVVRHLAQD